ncbi:MAG: SIR2 family protein [Myxococcota bacterium]|nr:SIR2 family protein [Myxococcota bacterium]
MHPVRTDGDLKAADDNNGAIPLYKPHGCISLPGQGASRMVVTSVDYFHSETLRAGMFDALRTLARECTTVFVGYSLDDFTFRNIFYTLHAEQGDWSNRAYSVAPIADPLYLRWLSRAMDRNFNTTVVDDTFEGFMIRLAATRGPLPTPLQQTVDVLWPTARTDNGPYLADLDPRPEEDSS